MYIYTALGALVQKKVTDGGTVQYTENYLGPYTYKTMGSGTTVSASDFSYLTTSKGRWVKNGSGTYVHEFFLKDHLGNTRVVYSDDNNDGTINPATEVKQYASYYPFGMMHYKAGTLADDNRKLYNGKEFESDLNLDWYDYGARMYDAALGRWMVIDPMIEKHYNYTPYAYVYNNPIRLIDPLGLDSAQRAAAVKKSQEFVDANPNKSASLYGGKGKKPGEATDCSGLVSASVVAGDEPDPNTGSEEFGCQNIINNTEKVENENDIQEGNVYVWDKNDGSSSPYHTAIVVDVKREDGVITQITVNHSEFGKGPVQDKFNPTDVNSRWVKRDHGYYKWDTKPDQGSNSGSLNSTNYQRLLMKGNLSAGGNAFNQRSSSWSPGK